FKPKRDEAAPIPICIKIVDFSLLLWTPTGISNISSFFGISIFVDSFTANRSRLTFARVCVLISKDSTLPDEIPIEIDGEDLVLKVLYDWKPDKCEGCGSLIHPFSLCPKNPNPQPVLPPQRPKNRGRSSSIPHSTMPHRSPSILPPTKPTNKVVNTETNSYLLFSLDSLCLTRPTLLSWNVRGFNNLDKVSFCMSLINSHDLKLLCILEAKISTSSVDDPWFLRSHHLFENESSCNNFMDSTPGRIWIKWDNSAFSFQQIFTSSQLIYGMLSVGSFPPIFLSVIYAANSVEDQKILWDQLMNSSPTLDQPWVVMGDFNYCRYESEKVGGSIITSSRLGELNSMIFNCGVQDITSIGLFFTWFNQRVDNPIHIKLDRVLINNALLDFLPNAYYTVEPPLGSNHSSLIFKYTHHKPISARFMFKNFWINMDGFWDDVLTAFSSRSPRSSMASFCHSLHWLKRTLKNRHWASSSYLSNALLEMKRKQHQCLIDIQSHPLDLEHNHYLKKINDDIASLQAQRTSWIAQRAKASWLTHGEDDLSFLFVKIRSRNNKNNIKEITTSEGHFTKFQDISNAIVKHFEGLFNTTHTNLVLPLKIPHGNLVPTHFKDMLVAPLTLGEVKTVVFYGNENSSPGPDEFTYAFYRKSWHLLGLQIFNVVNNFFTTSSLPKGVKVTAIALIPKSTHALSINDFRPISLQCVIQNYG
ncbi:uncharacterized protein LOC110098944, partial [Dendrobium catenatum]|uniref:uncharacterized protein LOC110098944 n=1 Tax=Dendrobium catenatum TaxID=906689 RepID=UPI0009F66C2C